MNLHSLRAKLIFNPGSGTPGESANQLLQILTQMQALDFQPEVYVFQPGGDLQAQIRADLRRGIRLFVVAGGDGTIDSVASVLAGTHAVMAVIPTGTRNNVALSLGIPADIPSAVFQLHVGREISVDVGTASFDKVKLPFLEVCSVGLLSALFPAADDIQHGNLARVGDLLSTLVSSPAAEIRLRVNGHQEFTIQGHVVLVGNMPFIGPHYRVSPDSSFVDGFLDVLVFANLNKFELIGSVVQTASTLPEDPRIKRYRAHSIEIITRPAMPIMVDGFPWPHDNPTSGPGPLKIKVERRSLTVIAGASI